jgi:putative hemolysin
MAQNTSNIKIDIDAIVKQRSSGKKVPAFVINYLKKIAHQDDINYFFDANPNVKNLEFIEAALKYLNITTSVVGKENLPPKGGKYIFAGNHPLGGMDGLTTGFLIGKEYDGKVRFFSNDLLSNLKPLEEMFIPVNKVGRQGKDHAEKMLAFYESDNQLVTYPAGMCSRKVKGKITDLEWKKNFINKAVLHERDIVPIYFEGRNSNFFYNLANFRKFFRIKFNIEMMYLADEMFKQRGQHFTLTIGKPIPWQTFDKSKSQTEWAQWVKEIVYKMADNQGL